MTKKSLGGKLKEVGAHSIIYGFGMIMQGLLGYILIPIYTKALSTDLFGVFSLLTVFASTVGSFFYFGASSALSRSYFDYESKEDRRKVVSTSLLITLIGASIQCLIGLLFSKEISLVLFKTAIYSNEIIIVLISSALTFINTLFYNVLRFERKSLLVIILNVGMLVISTALIIYFILVWDLGVFGAVLGAGIGQLLLCLTLFFVCSKYLELKILRKEIKIQLKFGFPAMLIGISYYFLSSADRFILSQVGSLSDVGIYSLGYKFGTIVYTIFITPFSQIWAPMRMEYRNDSDANTLFTLVSTYYFAVGMILTVLVSSFSSEIITLMSQKKEYLSAFYVIPPIMLGHLFYGAINILDSGIFFARKILWDAYILLIIGAISVGLNMIFVPHFGYLASAIIVLVSYILVAVVVWRVSNRLYYIKLELGRIGLILLGGIAVIFISYFLSNLDIPLAIASKILIIFGYFVYLYIFILTKEEKRKISSPKDFLNSLRLKTKKE